MMGFKCKWYINTASGAGAYATPTWTAVTLAKDVTIPRARTESEASCRDGDQESISVGQEKITFSTEILKKAGNAANAAILAAFEAGTPLDCFFADAPGGAGAPGKRGDFYITTHEEKQPLKERVSISVSGGRTSDNDHPYQSYTYPSS
jgi:hypothetical protein